MDTSGLEKRRRKRIDQSALELKKAIAELEEVRSRPNKGINALVGGTAGAIGGFVSGGPAGAVAGGLKGAASGYGAGSGEEAALQGGVEGFTGGAQTKSLESSGDIMKTLGASVKPENLSKTGRLLGSKELTAIGDLTKKEKTAKDNQEWKTTEAEKDRQLRRDLAKKTTANDNEKRKDIVKARENAIKSYDNKVKSYLITDSEEAFKKFVKDRVMAEVEGKYPEYKTTKAKTKKATAGHLWWKKEIDKVVNESKRSRTGKYVKPDKFIVGRIYNDAKGNKAKYIGNGEWEEQ